MIPAMTRRGFLPAAAAGLASISLPVTPVAAEAAEEPIETILEPGVHRVTANIVIKGDLLLKPGASIEVSAGRTLTLLGSLIAPIATIFTGTGEVDLNRARITHAHPEWWGAAPGDGSHDSLPALQACLRSHPNMVLLAGDYFISDSLMATRSFSTISGAGFRGTASGAGTRLIVTSGTADVLRVGPSSRPAQVNDFTQNITVRGIALCRSMPVDHMQGRAPAGLRAQFLLFGHFEQLSAFEHGIGFHAQGLVRTILRDCVAFRSLPGRSDGAPYHGFLLDGAAEIGLAGGNASLYLIECNATIGGDPRVSTSIGLLLRGAFADSFILEFETAGLWTGICVDGMTATIGGRARNGHVNLHIRMPIIDQCGSVGIDIRDCAPEALIDISDPYIAVGPSADTAFRFDRQRGTASITGGQLVGTTNSGAGGHAAGLVVHDSRNLHVTGLKILEHAKPIDMERCDSFSLHLIAINPTSQSPNPCLRLRDCAFGSVSPFISGNDHAFSAGVSFEGQVRGVVLHASGIEATSVGGAQHRVTKASRSMTIPYRDADLAIEGI